MSDGGHATAEGRGCGVCAGGRVRVEAWYR